MVHLGDNDPTVVGEHVVVGHRAVLHGCTIEKHSLIGMQATVLDEAGFPLEGGELLAERIAAVRERELTLLRKPEVLRSRLPFPELPAF